MSTYFQAWDGTLSTCPDPSTWTPENAPVVARFASGKPVAQGLYGGVLSWSALTPAEYDNLWDIWNTNKDSSGTFTIPDRSGTLPTSFRSVVAYAEEPSGMWGTRIRSDVTMRIVIVG